MNRMKQNSTIGKAFSVLIWCHGFARDSSGIQIGVGQAEKSLAKVHILEFGRVNHLRTFSLRGGMGGGMHRDSPELDAGVDEGGGEVGEQVAEHDRDRRDQRDADDDRDVDPLDRLPGELADAARSGRSCIRVVGGPASDHAGWRTRTSRRLPRAARARSIWSMCERWSRSSRRRTALSCRPSRRASSVRVMPCARIAS
jgi:hypothetical protein